MNLNPAIAFPQPMIDALRSARHVVVFTGARVSAESGIPTFRDSLTGLWERFNAQDLATPDAFHKDRELVWGWYEWRRMKVLRAQPNAAHLAIAALAQYVPQLMVITQNVDDLHERAGSTDVSHPHGSPQLAHYWWRPKLSNITSIDYAMLTNTTNEKVNAAVRFLDKHQASQSTQHSWML